MGTTKTNKKSLRMKEAAKLPAKRGVFRAPLQSSLFSVDDPIAGPSKVAEAVPPIRPDQVTLAKLSKPRKAAQREGARAGLFVAAATAKKRREKAKALSPAPAPLAAPPIPKLALVAEPWVHVSNLDPEAEAEDLADHFASCGAVQYVNIRYSNSGVPGRPQLGYRYAIVKFNTTSEADAAVELNGTKLMGSDYSLVVEPDLINLPEVQNLPEYLEAKRAEPALMEGVLHHPLVAPTDNDTLQTASGATVQSSVDVAKTKVWKPDPATIKKGRRSKGKSVTVGNIKYSMY
ncbi:hypothetical protein B0H12DRAFT_1238062 [Mycena haematopus]|nr:hypothetical protein B0H12DRAFT_1238062 [Mycena haematopus]